MLLRLSWEVFQEALKQLFDSTESVIAYRKNRNKYRSLNLDAAVQFERSFLIYCTYCNVSRASLWLRRDVANEFYKPS